MTNGTQTAPQAPQPQAAAQPEAPKKGGKGLKIFLGILGGCVVILIIVGVVGWFLVKNAAKKAGQEWEKALNEIEKTNIQLNQFEYQPVNAPAETPKAKITPEPEED